MGDRAPTAVASLTTAAIHQQIILVTADLAADVAKVFEGRAAVGDTALKDLAKRR